MLRLRLLLLFVPLLTGCDPSGGMGSINWSYPGTPGQYECDDVADPASWCATGEHPNMCDC